MADHHTILITGGSGFAGSHLAEHLLQTGHNNIHITSFRPTTDKTDELLPSDHIHQLDLNRGEDVTTLLKKLKPTQIYHLAAIAETGSSFAQAEATLINNTVLQLNVLEAVRQHSPKTRVVCIGSGQEYDFNRITDHQPVSETHPLGPANPYAVSKVTQDLLALSYFYSYNLDLVRTRPFNHLGERQSPQFAVPAFARQIALIEKDQEKELKVGNLQAIRDFTDVKDVVRAYALLMEQGQAGEVYNIGSGHGVSMKEVLTQLIALATVPIVVTEDPTKLRPIDTPVIVADANKIKQLGWQPSISLNDSLKRVLMYWRSQV